LFNFLVSYYCRFADCRSQIKLMLVGRAVKTAFLFVESGKMSCAKRTFRNLPVVVNLQLAHSLQSTTNFKLQTLNRLFIFALKKRRTDDEVVSRIGGCAVGI